MTLEVCLFVTIAQTVPSAAQPQAPPRAAATGQSSTFVWQPLGPQAVQTSPYGLITGRITSLALDPADTTGNHLYVGTTGGGVWVAQNAAITNATQVSFTPVTDSAETLSTAFEPSLSIGALTVQPGGTGVVLAGTGDPNDAFDSQYGTGILRSADGGNTWNAVQVTITNNGSVSSLDGLNVTAATGFTLLTNTCPTSLTAGASCTVGVGFAPVAAGSQSGNLAITSTETPTPVTVPMQGQGFDFSVALSGVGTATVSAGQSATFAVTLTPLNGSAGAFSFACDSLPKNALCLFSPPTETLSAGTVGNVQVAISTGSSTSGELRVRPWGMLVAPLVCGVLLLPWIGLRRTIRLWLFFACLGAWLFTSTGCTGSGGGGGGGSGGNGGTGKTPTGTYTIPLTMTSTGVSHSVTVTLVVD